MDRSLKLKLSGTKAPLANVEYDRESWPKPHRFMSKDGCMEASGDEASINNVVVMMAVER